MAGKVKILVADDVFIEPLKRLPKNKYTIIVRIGIGNEEILKLEPDVIIIRSTRKLDRKFLNRFSGSVIASFTKGLDHIDTDFAKRKGIAIINSHEGNSQSAAEHTILLILAASKNLIISDGLVREGDFKNIDFRRSDVSGRKVGIIGYGSIGKKVAKLCRAFGMEVIANDTDKKVVKKNKNVNFRSLNYILRNCDIVSLHIPLNPGNINLLSKEKLSLLKEDCIFVNTSRGEIIDEKYLIKLLKTNRIRAAALDVFINEPNVNPLFYELENVILSNHIAGKTVDSRKRIAIDVVKKIDKLF